MEFSILIKYNDRKHEKEIDELFTEFNFTKDVQENGEVFYRTSGDDAYSNMGIMLLRIKNKLYFHTFEKWDLYKNRVLSEHLLCQAYKFEKQGRIY